MQKTGQLLKEAREKKGLTIAEISHVTKINPKTLEALESGNVSGLPQKAFIRGFVQTYAKYLGLDVNETLKLFQEEMGQTKPILPMGELSGASNASSTNETTIDRLHKSSDQYNDDPRGKSRTWIIAIASVVLILLIGFVVQMIQKYEKESELPKDAPEIAKIETTVDTGAGSTTSTLEEKPATSAIVAITTSTTSTSPTSTTRSTTTTTLKPTTTSRSTTTTSRSTTTSTTKLTTTSTTKVPSSSTTSTTLAAEKPGKSIEVIVEALDNVTLGFRIDNGAFMTIKLAPQQVHTFKAKSSLAVDVSDGGALSVIYNGQDRGVPGSLGQPIKLKYP